MAAAVAVSARDVTLFYVSPTGNDAWSGTAPARAEGTVGPFRTLARARDAVRALREGGRELDKPVEVRLRGGTYRLDEPIVFGPRDSGTAACPVTYGAFQSEVPVLSGGRTVTGWTVRPDGSWGTTMPRAGQGEWTFRQLFLRRAGVAHFARRYRPCKGALVVAGLTKAPARKGMPHRRSQDEFRFAPGDIQPWANIGDVEVVVLHDWSSSRLRIREIDQENNIVRFTGFPVYRVGHWWRAARNPYYVENVKELFGKPGEWYLDRPNGELLYTPAEREALGNVEAVAPVATKLLELKGDAETGARIEHIRFVGLAFSHTNWQLPEKGYSSGQGMTDLPAAVEIAGGNEIEISNCTFSHLGAYAVGIGGACTGNRVVGCRMFDLGGGGVKVGGKGGTPKGNVVANNVITDGGRDHFSAHGIWSGITDGTVIRHNLVRRFLYSNVSIGWSWNDKPTACRANTVENNYIHDAMMLLADGGAIYSLGFQPGTVIRGNHIHDVHRSRFAGRAPNNGMFLDQGSKEFLIEDNTIYRTSGQPFRHNQNSPKWHTWKGNVLNVPPVDARFPAGRVAAAGPEPAYRHLVEATPIVPLPPMLSMELPGAIPPLPIRDDFEEGSDAGGMGRRHVQAAGNGISAEITDAVSAQGRRSLKLVDGPGAKKPFYPYVYYTPGLRTGRVTVSLLLRVDAGAHVTIEGRDGPDGRDYRSGPMLTVAGGRVSTPDGTRVADLPPGEWRRFELSFPVGREADGWYDCAVSAIDGEPVTFKCPMVSPGFRRLDWLGVVGHGTRSATFYLDDVQILN